MIPDSKVLEERDLRFQYRRDMARKALLCLEDAVVEIGFLRSALMRAGDLAANPYCESVDGPGLAHFAKIQEACQEALGMEFEIKT